MISGLREELSMIRDDAIGDHAREAAILQYGIGDAHTVSNSVSKHGADCRDYPIWLVQWDDATPRSAPSETGAIPKNIIIGCKLSFYGASALTASFVPGIPKPIKWGVRTIAAVVAGAGLIDIVDEVRKEISFRRGLE